MNNEDALEATDLILFCVAVTNKSQLWSIMSVWRNKKKLGQIQGIYGFSGGGVLMLTNQISAFFYDESGQGMTEYGAIVAFVGLLVALLFSAGGGLSTAIQSVFSSVIHSLNQIIPNGS